MVKSEESTNVLETVQFLNTLAPSSRLVNFESWTMPHEWLISERIKVVGYHYPTNCYAWVINGGRNMDWVTTNGFELLE